jgi:hypothetical protein
MTISFYIAFRALFAVLWLYDEARNVIETHEHKENFKD